MISYRLAILAAALEAGLKQDERPTPLLLAFKERAERKRLLLRQLVNIDQRRLTVNLREVAVAQEVEPTLLVPEDIWRHSTRKHFLPIRADPTGPLPALCSVASVAQTAPLPAPAPRNVSG